jgi:hypothetical protein
MAVLYAKRHTSRPVAQMSTDLLCRTLIRGIVGRLLPKKMAAIASCVRHVFVRNACLVRLMLPRVAAVGIQRNDIHTRTWNKFHALNRSSLIQVS